MRSLHMALPFLLFFLAIIIFVGRLADARPYQDLVRGLDSGTAVEGDRIVARGRVAGPVGEPLVAARGKPDFLTNGATVASLDELPATITLELDPPLTVTTAGAALVGLPAMQVADKERTVVRGGDVVTVFGELDRDQSVRAATISALAPQELYDDRLRTAVRVLVGGLGMLAVFYLLPPTIRLIRGFATEIRRSRAARLRQAERSDRDECPACQPSAARGFIACVQCGRPLERGPQLKQIREALQSLREGGGLLLSGVTEASVSLRFRRHEGMKLEIRSADMSVADTRAVRHVLSRVGGPLRRDPGPIWIINFEDAIGRAAAAAHGIFREVYGLDSDYGVETRRVP